MPYMTAADAKDHVRKMRTDEQFRIAGKNKPAEAYDQGVLTCIGENSFRALYDSGDVERLELHSSPSKCITNDIDMGYIVGVLAGSHGADHSDEDDDETVKQMNNEMKGVPSVGPGVGEGNKDAGDDGNVGADKDGDDKKGDDKDGDGKDGDEKDSDEDDGDEAAGDRKRDV